MLLVTPFALAILRARRTGSHCARFFDGPRPHFIAQQCNQFFPADRMCRLLRDQRGKCAMRWRRGNRFIRIIMIAGVGFRPRFMPPPPA
jgi:hypothetical protein